MNCHSFTILLIPICIGVFLGLFNYAEANKYREIYPCYVPNTINRIISLVVIFAMSLMLPDGMEALDAHIISTLKMQEQRVDKKREQCLGGEMCHCMMR